ncbi:hypothetical protein [Mycobacteroides abscessus]|uniref:hypothetical protein n=1 Tax=Mycobacteroides abscessus TaxID=36809 RepID=UPI0009A7F566|nr:hypothetical protein [Mycobacteroides abscessus]SLG48311.1 Uncharacterised protein [Mycobacteroides abscessus subsp. abscessus]
MSETVTESPEATAPEAPKPTPPAAKTSKEDDLPDWARQQISSANQEAANYRVQLREANNALQSAQEQVASLTAEKTQAVNASASIQTDFDKLVTAVKALAPEDEKKFFAFAKTLQGGSEDELTAHAVELKSIFGSALGSSPAYDPSQGRGAATSASPADAFAALLNSQLTR